MFRLNKLSVSGNGKQILKGVDLKINTGEIHILMGPNGSGKTTLAQVVMGNPLFKVSGGMLEVLGKDIKRLGADKRAKLGIFLGFQQPVEVPGVSMFNVLHKAELAKSKKQKAKSKNSGNSIKNFREQLLESASSLKLADDFIGRSLNVDFSGGEKKRSEILQMLALKPKLAILDEIDSGLDIDGLKTVASVINQFKKDNPRSSILLITHYERILKYLKPDHVHVIVNGKIVKSGQIALAKQIEDGGYKRWLVSEI
ncbi:Fe-S cluster assembly ATPase SufC [Candidatus Curtissbacteria bacterium RBG_13_35_7]|uniref:Fe-S cluster assembly ATPase SufC n=1 Tax=Candidatus Curtissbacteria bacterium RBG_13_35_7 TaxID=1797705 RepID=A0A1F5G4D6_9BACT|nr:MAG: Fe-S cluster assembly ATPase SufC [Candidatus Curtissbacteria bacterium RBG_13_35_7]